MQKKSFTRILSLLLVLLTISRSAGAQVTTNSGSGLAASYPSLAAAITALNSATISSPVTITLTANETAPAGGYNITASGSSANPITISGGGFTITASSGHTAGSRLDAVFKITGGDYITLQNFVMTENAANTVTAVATNTMTEFGVALFYNSTTDGAQNNTISNNTISLSGAYQNATGIYSNTTHSATVYNTAANATANSGLNSGLKVYGNTINNVALGIQIITPPNTSTLTESGIDIGGTAAATGNTINYGNNTAADAGWNGFSAVSCGIGYRNGVAVNIRYNTVISASMTIATTGILLSAGTTPSSVTYTNTVSNNTLTINQTGTAAATGINQGYGISTGTMITSNNNVTINRTVSAASSAAVTGISTGYTAAVNTMANNTITINEANNGSSTALSGSVTGISATGAATTVNVNSNTVNIKQAAPSASGTYTGTITYIDVAASSSTINVLNNVLSTQGSTIRATGTLTGVNQGGSQVGVLLNIKGNNANIDRVAASGTVYFHYTSTSPSEPADTISNNSIFFTNLAGTTSVTAIASLGGASATGTSKNINNNTINISGNNSGTTKGISAGYSFGNMVNNSIVINTAATSVYGIDESATGAGAYVIGGNTVSLTTSGTSPSLYGVYATATGPFQISTNNLSVFNASAAGTSAPTIYPVYVSASAANTVFGNIITGVSTGAGSGSATIAGIAIAGGTTTAVYKNKIYDLQTAATGTATFIRHISVTSGTTANIYNNLIGQSGALTGVNNADAIRAISIATGSSSTANVYYNTILLNASSTGTNFGTSGIYATASATASTAALDLRNNIVINVSTPAGTGITAAYRRSASNLANYVSTSNRNMLYAGTPGAANLVMYDGTNSYQAFASYQTAVAPRDANSFTNETGFNYTTAGSFFQSVTGSASNFLQPVAGITTQAESGGVAVSGVTDDYNGAARPATGTAPDLGAWEFTGVTPAPVITLNSISPAGVQCTATAHTVSVNITTAAGTITGATLSYTFNGVAGTGSPVALTNTTGTTWTGTIPVASPVNAAVVWSITATNSINLTATYNGAGYSDAPLTGFTATASVSAATSCANAADTLRASFLPVVGFSEMFETFPLSTFSVSGTSATATQNTAFVQQGSSSVYLNTTATSATATLTGNNNIDLSAYNSAQLKFNQICGMEGSSTAYDFGYVEYSTNGGSTWTTFPTSSYAGAGTLQNSLVCFSTLSYPAWVSVFNSSSAVPNNSLWRSETINVPAAALTSQFRLRFRYTTDVSTNYFGWLIDSVAIIGTKQPGTISWSNGATTVGTGSPFVVNPAATTTYTASVTANGCALTSNPVTINVLPAPAVPTATNSNQCGTQVPTASVADPNGFTTPTFKWYSAATGGTLLQSSTSATYTTAVAATTTFYVSVVNPATGCESDRTPVTVTVASPDVVTAKANGTAANAGSCIGSSVSLTATQTGTINNYTYTWTASPAAGSGIATSQSGQNITVTPTAAGVYTYTVTAVDGSCTTTSTVVDTVKAPFAGVTVTATASPAVTCSGGADTLRATVSPVPVFTENFETFPLGSFAVSGTGASATQNTTYSQQGSSSVLFNTTATSATANLAMTGNVNLSAYTTAQLKFYQICAMEGSSTAYDFGYVEYSTDGGANWTTFPTSSYAGTGTLFNSAVSFSTLSYANWTSNFTSSAATPTNALWQAETINIPAAAMSSSQFRVRFRYTTDITVNYYGWLIDSVTIVGAKPFTVAWSNGSTTVGTSNPQVVNPTVNTTYTATVSNSGCTAVSNPVSVTISPLTAATVSATSTAICTGKNDTLSVSVTGAGAPFTYSWSDGSSVVGTTQTIIVAPTSTKTYTVTVTNTCSQTVTASKTITVNPLPTAVASSNSPVCTGAALNLTGTTNIGTQFSWTGPGFTSSQQNPSISNVTFAAAGTYSFTATSAAGCISPVATTTVVINASPANVSVTPATATICFGGSTQLTAAFGTTPNAIFGTGTNVNSTTGYPAPYTNYYGGTKHQMLIRASELTAAGFVAGTKIKSIAFNVSSVGSTFSGTLQNFQINMGQTTSTTLNSSAFEAAPTLVYGPLSQAVAVGTVTHTLATPFTWNGTDNIVIQTSYSNNNAGTSTDNVQMTNTDPGFVSTNWYRADNTAAATVLSAATPTSSSNARPNMVMGIIQPFTITWSPVTGLFKDAALTQPLGAADTNTIVYASPAGNTTYTATSVTASGCSRSAAAAVTVNPLPDATISGASAVCVNATTTYTAATSGGTWISANTAIATVNSTTGVITGVSAGTDTIRYTVTNANGCTNTSFKVITVNALPVVSISPATASICVGSNITLTASGAVSYSWTPSAGLSATNTASVVAGPLSTTIYTVTGTNANGCANTATRTVTVNALPVVSVSPATATICIGNSVTLTGNGAVSYSWSPATGLSATTGTTVTASPTSNITYTVTGTDANGCINTGTAAVTVNPLPDATISGASAVCVNATTTYTAATSGGTWISANTAIATVNSTTGVITGVSAGTDTIRYTVTNANGCTNTSFKVITVNALPVVSISPATASICVGSNITLTASGAVSYSWAPSAGLSATNTASVVAGPPSTTIYTVTGTNANGCANTATRTVTVNALPVVSVSPATATICNGNSVTLTGNGAASYSWSPATGLSATTGTTVTASPTSNITYTVTGTDANGCINTGTATITVNPTPVISSAVGSNPTTCTNNNGTITISGLTPNTSYSISYLKNGAPVGPFTGSTNAAGQYVITNLGVGTYTQIKVAFTSTGCTSAAAPTVVLNNPVHVPAPVVANSGPLCVGDTLHLSATDSIAVVNYQWTGPGGFNTTTQNPAINNVTLANAGVYSVTAEYLGCISTPATTTVVIHANPQATVTPLGATTICQGTTVTLQANTGAGLTYQWYNGTAPVGPNSATYTVSVSGSYSVMVTNINGCHTKSAPPVNVTVVPPPPAVITHSTPLDFCDGKSVTLHAPKAAGYTYQWFFNNNLVSTADSIVVTQPGTCYVKVTNATGCQSTSAAVTIITYPVINPIITRSGNVLSSSGYTAYQWYMNNSPIPGATSASYTVTQNGYYTVEATDANGCVSMSAIAWIKDLGIGGGIVKEQIRIYPNPAQSIVHIDAPVTVNVQLRSIHGQIVAEYKAAKDIDISQLADGVYMISIFDKEGRMLGTERLIKAQN